MGIFKPAWSRLHREERFGFLSPFLAFCSFIYGLGVQLRLYAYKSNIFRKRTLPGFVVSIGNLTAGGTGKTPAVVMLARWALGEGYRVAVLSRGYGGSYKKRVLEVSDGEIIKADPRESGDEPYLIAKNLPGVPVVVSRKRYLAGLFANTKFGCDFFILDDGFQHIALKRDFDIVLIDASKPFGNGHLLPWGPLREPLKQLARADGFFITRSNRKKSGDIIEAFLKKGYPEKPVFFADHVPEKIILPGMDKKYNPEFLKGKGVVAFAGIANPEVFKMTLKQLGAEIKYFKSFSDHYPFNHNQIRKMISLKEKFDAGYVITTEKDWVKANHMTGDTSDLIYLSVQFSIVSEDAAFFLMLKAHIDKEYN